MTLLSWGAIEYGSRYEAIGEMEHIMEIIKWGTDYILETFNASNVDKIYVQVHTKHAVLLFSFKTWC